MIPGAVRRWVPWLVLVGVALVIVVRSRWVAVPAAGHTVVRGELVVEVTVRNGGAMEADEVVQVYLEPPGRQVERPARVLVGFQRASLAMAEQRRLVLRIPLRRLAYFEESSDGFVLEPGLHRLVVARHAEDAGLALELPVDGRFLGR